MSSLLDRLRTPELVALHIAAEQWPRGMFAPTLIPDAWIGLIAASDGRRWLTPSGEDPRPPRGGRLLLVRNRPIVVPLARRDVSAACGADCSAEVELLVRWPPREEALAALLRSGLVEPELTLERLAEAVAAGGAAAGLTRWLGTQPAAGLTGADHRDTLQEVLRRDLGAFSFETGLELAAVARLEISSRLLSRQRAQAAAVAERHSEINARRLIQEAALAAARQHLSGVAGLLNELRQTAERSGSGGWTHLLAALGPLERGRMLEALWRVSPRQRRTTALLAITTRELAWLAPASPHALLRRCALPTELGLLRAVTWDSDEDELWIGAAQGLWRLDPDSGAVRSRHALPAGISSPGDGACFSRLLPAGAAVIAAHRLLGLWLFPRDPSLPARPLPPSRIQPSPPSQTGAGSAAALCRSGADHLLCGTEAALELRTLEGALVDERTCPPGIGRVHALAASGERLYVATESAGLLETDRPALQPDTLGTGEWRTSWPALNPVESVAMRRWGDVLELLLPAGSHGITALYPEERFETPLCSGAFPIRRVWAADDLVVGLSAARDQLLLASDATPPRGGSPLHLARMLGAAVADVCLRTAPLAAAPAAPARPSGDLP